MVEVLSDNSNIFVLDLSSSELDFSNPGFEKWDGDLDALNDDEIDALLNFELKDADCGLETDGRPQSPFATTFSTRGLTRTPCLLVPDQFITAPCTNVDDKSVLYVSTRPLAKPLRAQFLCARPI